MAAVVAIFNMAIVAHYFGASRHVEIYFAATALLRFVVRISQTGQVSEIVLPIFHQTKHKNGVKEAYLLFSIVLNWLLILLTILIVILWNFSMPLVEIRVPGFQPDDIATGALYFRVLLPLVLVQIATALLTTLAHAESWFGIPEFGGLLANMVSMACLLILAPQVGPWALIWALWSGQFIHLVCVIVFLYRKGFRHRLRLNTEIVNIWHILGRVMKTLPYVGATQLYAFAFDAALSMLPQGTFAIFKYILQIQSRAQTLLLRPISIVFFTQFSDAFARASADLRRLAQKALAHSLFFMVPLITAITAASYPLVETLLGQKGFSNEQLHLAAELLAITVLLSLAIGLQQIGRKMTMSLGMVGRQYYSNTLVQIVSFLLTVPLIEAYGIVGAVGMFILNNVALSFTPILLLRWFQPELAVFYPWDRVWRWVVAVAIALPVTHYSWMALGLERTDLNRADALLTTVGLSAICLTTLLVAAMLLRIDEVRTTATALLRLCQGRWSARGGD